MNRLTFILLFFISLSTAIFSQSESSKVLLDKTNAFFNNAEHDSAFVYSKKAFKIFNSNQQDSLTVEVAIIATISKNAARIKDSINYIDIAERIAFKRQNWKWLMNIFYAKGHVLLKQREFTKALPLFLKVDSISNLYNFKNESLVKSIIDRAEMSRLTFTKEGSQNAEKLLFEALDISKAIHSDEMINFTYVYLADVSGLMDKLDDAKRYIDLAFNYYLKVDNVRMVSRLYLVNSVYYKAIDDMDNALKSRKAQVAYVRTKNDSDALAEALTYYGKFLRMYTDKHQLAIDNYKEAKKIYENLGKTETALYQNLLRGMAIEYKALGDYKNSTSFFEDAYYLKLDLQKKENQEVTKTLEAKYQNAKKEQEITLLTSQKDLAEQQKTNQLNLLLAGIGLSSIAGIFFFVLYKNRQKTTKKLRELDAFKSKFFTNISHEFRTPLTLISGPIDKRLSNEKLNEEDRAEFTMIQRNSSRLLNLVDQLLDLSKLESGHLKLNVIQGNLSELLRAISASFQHQANQKNISYTAEIQDLGIVFYDKDVIEKTIINLLSNAFKYTPEQGVIMFNVSAIENQLKINIENSGNQLTKIQIENIFNRFYQANENSDGVGIGLSLVKELVELSHGKIDVKNTSENRIVFKINLPILKSQFKSEELVKFDMDMLPFEPKPHTVETEDIIEQVLDEDLPILLIVDDHKDIRTFVKSAFKDNYQVVEANDGETGIEKAIALVPDIIISDVMMPNKNGFELTSQLKQDERTCHIPIILLTAKVEDASRFEGLETGADEYITKPFKIKGLETRVKNLINSRLKLRERYSQELVLRPKDIVITTFDEQFLEKIQKILDEKLTESSFSVQDFSEAVGMSRMQLHRKLKALTGLSATEFVRSQRLKLAAELLKKSDANVSEIGYMVGFNDHSYFAKCFKEYYGCSPTEYSSTI